MNRCGSIQFRANNPHVQSDQVHNHFECGKSELFEICTSGNVRDCTRYIQAVTLHHHQNDWSQKVAESKEGLLRNNYGIPAIRHELSGAPHPTGTQNQTQSRVAGTSKSNGAEGLINGQQPRSVLTACVVDKGVKSDAPPSGDERSLTRRRGEGLKWRYRSRTIGCYAQLAGRYNGVRYLLQYARRRTARPQLMSITECVKRTTDTSSRISQQLLVTTGSCDGSFDSLQCVSSLPSCGRSANDKVRYNAFPKTSTKCMVDLPRPPAVGLSSTLSGSHQKCVHKPKYNCVRRSKKFTGCMQGKRKLSMENRNNRHGLCTSNGNIEPLCVGGKEMLQRHFHSNAKPRVQMQQCTLTHVAVPTVDATADRETSVTSARARAPGTFPAMSTSSPLRQRIHGGSVPSPNTAYPPEIEWYITATNALDSVSMLQNVDVNASCNRASNSTSESKSMLQSYVRSFEGRPRVCMARTKGSVQRDRGEKEQERDDSRRPDERHQAGPSKRGDDATLQDRLSISVSSVRRLTDSVPTIRDT